MAESRRVEFLGAGIPPKAGTCHRCGATINVGDMVWNQAPGYGRFHCSECADEVERGAPFIQHPSSIGADEVTEDSGAEPQNPVGDDVDTW